MLLVANLLKYGSYVYNTDVHNYDIMLSQALAIYIGSYSDNFYYLIANAILVLCVDR